MRGLVRIIGGIGMSVMMTQSVSMPKSHEEINPVSEVCQMIVEQERRNRIVIPNGENADITFLVRGSPEHRRLEVSNRSEKFWGTIKYVDYGCNGLEDDSDKVISYTRGNARPNRKNRSTQTEYMELIAKARSELNSRREN